MGFPATALATNCYVIAPTGGQECVVVDPGAGVVDRLDQLLREHGLRAVAIVLTHGHLDHVASVPELAGDGLPTYIHADDRYRLQDPAADLDPGLVAMFAQQTGQSGQWTPPTDVVEMQDGQTLRLAGLELTVHHAPGHTEGSVLLSMRGVPDALGPDTGLGSTVLSGDVLFAGSIGRTDLPGGDGAAMETSLRDVVLPLPDDALVLPGHGPASTMERERSTNPYLQGL